MLIIEKQKINELVQKLAEKVPVFMPVRRKNPEESIFEKFDSPTGSEIDFDYLPTVRSIKEFFLPEKENIFWVFGKKRISAPPMPKKIVLFGLNIRDLEALIQLDEIMAKPKNDYFYFRKRNATIIVGLINESPAANKQMPAGDLILLKINQEQYEVLPQTDKGRNLVKIAKNFLKKEPGLVTNVGVKIAETMPQLRQLLLDPELLSDAVTWSWRQDYSIWEELGNLCLGCGICTYVCPLCYCFSVEDSVALDGKTCIRCRQWDACTLPRFSQISGGFNFHKTIKERYYNWFFHKFVRAYKEYGKSQCVACGRCQKYCPAKIDIENYLLKIVENYKKAMGLK